MTKKKTGGNVRSSDVNMAITSSPKPTNHSTASSIRIAHAATPAANVQQQTVQNRADTLQACAWATAIAVRPNANRDFIWNSSKPSHCLHHKKKRIPQIRQIPQIQLIPQIPQIQLIRQTRMIRQRRRIQMSPNRIPFPSTSINVPKMTPKAVGIPIPHATPRQFPTALQLPAKTAHALPKPVSRASICIRIHAKPIQPPTAVRMKPVAPPAILPTAQSFHARPMAHVQPQNAKNPHRC